jgi:hypothetical protein
LSSILPQFKAMQPVSSEPVNVRSHSLVFQPHYAFSRCIPAPLSCCCFCCCCCTKTSGQLEGKSLQEWAAAGEAGEPRLFLVDYWPVYEFLDTLEKVNAGSNRVMHAGRCVLFR